MKKAVINGTLLHFRKTEKFTVKESSWGYKVKNDKKTAQKNAHTLFSKNLGHFSKNIIIWI